MHRYYNQRFFKQQCVCHIWPICSNGLFIFPDWLVVMSFIVPTGQWSPVFASRNRLYCWLNSPMYECVFKYPWTAWHHLAYVSVPNTSSDVGAAILVSDTHRFFKYKLQYLDSFKVSLQAKQCQESYYVQIYSRPAFVSQPADTGTITNLWRVFSLDAWDFFFSLYAGSHWSFQICLSKENVTFIKKKQQQWRASVVYQPSLSNYYRCINHIDARCYHYFSPLLT